MESATSRNASVVRKGVNFVSREDLCPPGQFLCLVVGEWQTILVGNAAVAGVTICRSELNPEAEFLDVRYEEPADMPSSRLDIVVPEVVKKVPRGREPKT